jgi:hypothetical protein
MSTAALNLESHRGEAKIQEATQALQTCRQHRRSEARVLACRENSDRQGGCWVHQPHGLSAGFKALRHRQQKVISAVAFGDDLDNQAGSHGQRGLIDVNSLEAVSPNKGHIPKGLEVPAADGEGHTSIVSEVGRRLRQKVVVKVCAWSEQRRDGDPAEVPEIPIIVWVTVSREASATGLYRAEDFKVYRHDQKRTGREPGSSDRQRALSHERQPA